MNLRIKISLIQTIIVFIIAIITNLFTHNQLMILIIESIILSVLAGLTMYFAIYKIFKK